MYPLKLQGGKKKVPLSLNCITSLNFFLGLVFLDSSILGTEFNLAIKISPLLLWLSSLPMVLLQTSFLCSWLICLYGCPGLRDPGSALTMIRGVLDLQGNDARGLCSSLQQ